MFRKLGGECHSSRGEWADVNSDYSKVCHANQRRERAGRRISAPEVDKRAAGSHIDYGLTLLHALTSQQPIDRSQAFD